MVSWVERPSVQIDLGQPMGERFDAVDPQLIRASKKLLDSIRMDMPAGAMKIATLMSVRTGKRFDRELKAMAKLAQIDWKWLMVANVSYDFVLKMFCCSTMALPTPEGPVLARNMDWWPQNLLAQASCTLVYRETGELRFAIAGWPGSVGVVTGMSGNGFAIAINAVAKPRGDSKTGYPVLLHMRRVLEDAKNYHDAVDRLTTQKLMAPALLTVVGTRNSERVVIERTATTAEHRTADNDKPLLATNDYKKLDGGGNTWDNEELWQSTCARYDALVGHCDRLLKDKQTGDDALLYVLSEDNVIQQITAQHIIVQPSTRRMRHFVPAHLLGEGVETRDARSPRRA